MYIYTPLCRYWIVLYRYVLVFIVPHVDIELEDNKQFISNIPRNRLGFQCSFSNLFNRFVRISIFFIAPACSRVRYRHPILSHLLVAGCDIGVRFSVRLSTFMLTFDIYVKVSILINYKTKQPSNLTWNISLTSWLCDIGVCFSVCLSVRPSICQQLCRSSTFMSKLVF